MSDNVSNTPISPPEDKARFEAAKNRLHLLLLCVPAAAVRFDARSTDYRAGVAETIFATDKNHLRDKLLGYDSVNDFLSYYTISEPGVRMLSHLSGRECTEADAHLYRNFIILSCNNNIAAYTAKMQQPEIWADYLKKSGADYYGNITNWGKFYRWLHKNADVSWSRALLGKFLNYR